MVVVYYYTMVGFIYSISKENGSTSAGKIYYSTSNQFLENQPAYKICSHLTEKASKGRFLSPRTASKITVTKEKKRRKRKSEEIRKGGEEKKAMVALLVFIMSYFGYSFWRKKTVGRKRSI